MKSMNNATQQKILLLIIFLSGVTALGYQVLWTRIFGLVFGLTVYAVSTVLTAFMAGLALGSYLFGRWSEKKNPLILFICIETGIALFALLFPLLFDLQSTVYSGLFKIIPQNFYVKNAVRFLFSFLFLLIPTTLMGGTLPVAGKIMVKTRFTLGKTVGRIYSLNNLGAVLGCFIAGFILMHTVGVRGTMIFAALINSINIILLILLRKFVPKYEPKIEEDLQKWKKSDSRRFYFLVLLVFAVEGFCALGYEVIWTRILLDFSYDKSSYFMSTVIISFVFGLAFGSYLISKVVDRSKKPALLFGWIEVAIGLTALLLLTAFPYMLDYLIQLRPAYSESWWRSMGYEYLMFFLIMLIPTTLMGMAYPVVSKLYITHLTQVGRRLGTIGYLDTIGSILGAFSAGFLLIPLFGVVHSTIVLAAGNLLLGLVLIIFAGESLPSTRWKRAGMIILFTGLVLYTLPDKEYFKYWQTAQPADRLLFYEEGSCTTVAVPQHLDGVTELAINGSVTAYAEYHDIRVHKLLAHLPYLLHNNPQRALVIGLGMGVTANSLVKADSLLVDCVEISPEVKMAAQSSFAVLNENVLNRNNFNFILDDGRSHLQITSHKYDIISSNAVNARLSGNLYTTEFYQLCKQRLAENGIMCQWLSTNWILESEYKMLLKSFIEVFPNTSLWCLNAGHLLLIGTPEPLKIDYQNFRNKIKRNSVSSDLKDYGLSKANAVLALYVCASGEITAYIGSSTDNRDDLPLVEMSRVVNMARNPDIIESIYNQKKNLESILAGHSLSPEDSITLHNYFLAEKLLLESTLKSRYTKKPMEALQALIKATQLAPDNYTLHKNLAILYYAGGNRYQAIKSLMRAINIHPKLAENHERLGILYFESALYEDALVAFKNALLLEPERPLPRYYRAAIFKLLNKPLLAISDLREIINYFPKYIDAYYSLALIYEEQKDFKNALKYYRHCYNLNSDYKNVGDKIKEIESLAGGY